MEKLQQVLAYKFWIGFGLALILPTVGWYMATNDLAASTTSRTGQIDQAFANFDNGKTFGKGEVAKIPNSTWTESITRINDGRQRDLSEAASGLRESQAKFKTWPAKITGVMADAKWATAPGVNTTAHYKNSYIGELERVRAIAKPYDPKTGEGNVQLPLALLPQSDVTFWSSLGPEPSEMWEAQEDIWLTRAILESIAQVNGGGETTDIMDAPIRVVQTLTLHGGSSQIVKKGGTLEAQTTRTKPRYVSASAFTKIDVRPASVFGPDSKVSTEDGGGEVEATGLFRAASKNRRSRGAEDEQAEVARRYVEDGSTQPFKTRGFSLKVIIDHTRVPDLVAELSNMPWSVEILRVHQIDTVDAKYVPAEDEKKTRGRNTPTAPNFGGRRESERAVDAQINRGDPHAKKFLAATTDPTLATVVVAGLMTLYTDPKVEATDATNQSGSKRPPVGNNSAAKASAPTTTAASATVTEKETESEPTTTVATDSPSEKTDDSEASKSPPPAEPDVDSTSNDAEPEESKTTPDETPPADNGASPKPADEVPSGETDAGDGS